MRQTEIRDLPGRPILAAGGTITQETRHYHEEDGSTSSGRVKSIPRITVTSPSWTWSRLPPASGWKGYASRFRSCPRLVVVG